MANPTHIPQPSAQEEARFWTKVDKRKSHECWNWLGGKFSQGYGCFVLRGKARRAHRVLYVWTYGELAIEYSGLDHICDNRACVNPDHLRPASTHENTLRGKGPTAVNARKTHCVNGHKFTASTTFYDAGGWRQCRLCRNDRARARIAADGDRINARRREIRVRVSHAPRVCPECGASFVPTRSDKHFCSTECAAKVRMRRFVQRHQ